MRELCSSRHVREGSKSLHELPVDETLHQWRIRRFRLTAHALLWCTRAEPFQQRWMVKSDVTNPAEGIESGGLESIDSQEPSTIRLSQLTVLGFSLRLDKLTEVSQSSKCSGDYTVETCSTPSRTSGFLRP